MLTYDIFDDLDEILQSVIKMLRITFFCSS